MTMADLTGGTSPRPYDVCEFNPRAWLARFEEGGGAWFVSGDLVYLGYPLPPANDIADSRSQLTESQMAQVRAEILSSYPEREA